MDIKIQLAKKTYAFATRNNPKSAKGMFCRCTDRIHLGRFYGKKTIYIAGSNTPDAD